ncbi:hypothetical protein MMC08_006848 [Hypocenomyce scalaris]|nr:hypothetical protein [Hypocenomyce scalaris]
METEAFIKKGVDDKMNKKSRQRMDADVKKYVREYLKTETSEDGDGDHQGGEREGKRQQEDRKGREWAWQEDCRASTAGAEARRRSENQPANEKDGEELDVGEAFEVVENIEVTRVP